MKIADDMPEMMREAVMQAEIERLKAALVPFAAKVRPNDFDPMGLARFGVSGRAKNDDYRAAYGALNFAPKEPSE